MAPTLAGVGVWGIVQQGCSPREKLAVGSRAWRCAALRAPACACGVALGGWLSVTCAAPLLLLLLLLIILSATMTTDIVCVPPGAAYNTSSATSYPILQRIEPATVRPLDGGSGLCAALSSAGTSSQIDGRCFDLGIGNEGGRWYQLAYLPQNLPWDRAADSNARLLATRLQAELTRVQAGGAGCDRQPLYTVAELPTIGFCATIEFGMLALARAASSGGRLVFGQSSASTWSSSWLCGPELSLGCYFNVSGTCCPAQASFAAGVALEGGGGVMSGVGPMGARSGHANGAKLARARLKHGLKRRLHGGGESSEGPSMVRARKMVAVKAARGTKGSHRDDLEDTGGLEYGRPRALSLGGTLNSFNRYGTLWVSAQLVHWLFSRMHPTIRRAIDTRRAGVLPRTPDQPSPLTEASDRRERCIGMHVRRGDSCSLGSRFCPRNFTQTYFAAAARLRRQYGINKLVVATDDAGAADMCARGAMGFNCHTMAMDRVRFDARQSIERRVVHHTTGLLSGSAVSLDALADVEMLSECDAHVLVLRSAVSRLALALSVARKGRHSPLISLQWPWGGLPR